MVIILYTEYQYIIFLLSDLFLYIVWYTVFSPLSTPGALRKVEMEALIRNAHILRDCSKTIVFFLKKHGVETAKVLNTHYRHSWVAQELEIPYRFIFMSKILLTETVKTSLWEKWNFTFFFIFLIGTGHLLYFTRNSSEGMLIGPGLPHQHCCHSPILTCPIVEKRAILHIKMELLSPLMRRCHYTFFVIIFWWK